MTVQMNPQAPKFAASLQRRVLEGGGVAEKFDDVVLVSGARTPFGKMGGNLEQVSANDLMTTAMKGALAKAGVDFRVCGQAVMGRQIDPATIQPEIQLDLWALTTFMNLQQQGYVRVGGGVRLPLSGGAALAGIAYAARLRPGLEAGRPPRPTATLPAVSLR